MSVCYVQRIADRLAVWQLAALTLFSFVATYFVVMQVVAIAWLASFPGSTAQAGEMEKRFWVFAVAGCLLTIVDLVLLVVWMVRICRVRAARRRELIE